jgi:hypothetical protein
MKHKEYRENIAVNLIKMKKVKKHYQNMVTEVKKYEEMMTAEEDRMVQTSSIQNIDHIDHIEHYNNPTHLAHNSFDYLHKHNLKYKDSSNENIIKSKYKYFRDSEELLNAEFQSKQNETSTRRILLKKIDLDTTLGGKFSNRFKENLLKTKNRIDIIPPELHLEDTLNIWKVDKYNKNTKNTISLDSNYLNLPLLTSFKFSSSSHGVENTLKNSTSSPKALKTNYNHSSHLKQKFINHKKLFGNQHDIKKIYYALNNVHNDMINVKINFQNEEIRSKGKDKKIKKVIDYRKIFQQRLAEKKKKTNY